MKPLFILLLSALSLPAFSGGPPLEFHWKEVPNPSVRAYTMYISTENTITTYQDTSLVRWVQNGGEDTRVEVKVRAVRYHKGFQRNPIEQLLFNCIERTMTYVGVNSNDGAPGDYTLNLGPDSVFNTYLDHVCH